MAHTFTVENAVNQYSFVGGMNVKKINYTSDALLGNSILFYASAIDTEFTGLAVIVENSFCSIFSHRLFDFISDRYQRLRVDS